MVNQLVYRGFRKTLLFRLQYLLPILRETANSNTLEQNRYFSITRLYNNTLKSNPSEYFHHVILLKT